MLLIEQQWLTIKAIKRDCTKCTIVSATFVCIPSWWRVFEITLSDHHDWVDWTVWFSDRPLTPRAVSWFSGALADDKRCMFIFLYLVNSQAQHKVPSVSSRIFLTPASASWLTISPLSWKSNKKSVGRKRIEFAAEPRSNDVDFILLSGTIDEWVSHFTAIPLPL